MGHTLSTITQSYHRFISYLKPFRRALRQSDQRELDSLLDEASQHLPAASHAANLLPGVAFLLSLILEKHKQVKRLEADLENLRADITRELIRTQNELKVELQKLRAELFLLNNKSNKPNGH